ncbi:MAG: FAD-dependent oxidoreductase [Sulfurihydrogenibium sp.]
MLKSKLNVNRRDLIKTAFVLSAANVIHSQISFGEESAENSHKAKVIVVGGGYGGVSFAVALKKANRDIDVILIEKNLFFVSCPMSNLYLTDLFDFSNLCYPCIDYDVDENLENFFINYPPAFKPGQEHLFLKKLLSEFESGDIVITVPSYPYRCPPAPYERAALILNYLKRRNLKAKLYFIL